MKVAYLLPSTSLHGGNRVPADQGKELIRRGHDVEIWSPSKKPKWHTSTVKYVKADIFAKELPCYDVCIATFWPTASPACATKADQIFHLCQGFEGIHRENAQQLPLIDEAYLMPTRKLVVSHHLSDILFERYGVPTTFIGTGINRDTFRPGWRVEESKKLRIGVVGSFEIRPKGVEEVLSGLRLARDKGYSFELWRASSTPYRDEERQLGLRPRFFTQLSTDEMAGFYRSIDCLIHGSWNEEGFGLPPLEAGACGCAVAATDIDPMKAFSEVAILRFPPAREDVVPDVVERLSSSATRQDLIAGMHRDLPLFDIRTVVDRLESAFGIT